MDEVLFGQVKELLALFFFHLTALIIQVLLAWKTGKDRREIERMTRVDND